MNKISEYKIIENIAQTDKSIIYRCLKDNKNYILKVLKSSLPSPSEIARFKQEYDIIKKLDEDGIVGIFDIIEENNEFTLVQEDFNGISLKKYISSEDMPGRISLQFDMRSFLEIAVKLSVTLGNIHRKNIIHKDIKPSNIIINPENFTVKITDFGIANEITHKNDEVYHPEIIEGTLPYISPEQTGRMNRSIDYRTDIYSLGITFYEMLAGKVPFDAKDPMEIIHSHIAREAIPLVILNPMIPEIISEIISKLMSKNAEERYQSSHGLTADLKLCYDELIKNGTIDKFKFQLGQKDFSIKFNIPQKLIGRENDIRILSDAFERVSNGTSEVMLVSGNPGIGKSALINEIHKTIVAKRGYFISGKYDQFRRDVPYSSIIQAFQGLIKQIFTEGDERINKWRNKILKAVGSNGKIIIDILPVVELIIGKQKDVPDLEPMQSQNRFNYVFKSFVNVFIKEEHPLTIFLDDIQWADLASLNFIKMILTDSDNNYLLLIGSYRDNEVNSFHPLIRTVNDIKKENIIINSIQVEPLTIPAVNQLLLNFFRCNVEKSLELAEIIFEKTNGNPFFINQFLKSLYDGHIIEIDSVHGWIWDISKIEKLSVTDNVVELLAGKISTLPENIQKILQNCACIGNRFDLVTLSEVSEKSIEETLVLLMKIIDEGFISLYGDIYKFYHDRIQEAAYSLISDDEKERIHLKIGSLYLNKSTAHELQEKILYIVDQLNAGKNLVKSVSEKNKLAELNLAAGRKAKASAAFNSASIYYNTGIELLGENGWKDNFRLMHSLHEEAVEASYLSSDFNAMEKYSDIALSKTKDILEQINIYRIKISTCMALNKPLDGIKIGLDVLKKLGLKIPERPNILNILISLFLTRFALLGKNDKYLLDLPAMKNNYIMARLQIMSALATASYFANPNLLVIIAFKSIRLTIKYGNASFSPFAYAGYGYVNCSIGEIKTGYRFGRISIDLLNKMKDAEAESFAKTHFVMNGYIRHWTEHVRSTFNPFITAYHNGLEVGDFEFAAYNFMAVNQFSFHVGINLIKLNNDMQTCSDLIKKINQKSALYSLVIYHQCVINLIEITDNPGELIGTAYDENIMVPMHLKAGDISSLVSLYVLKVVIFCIFCDYKNAVENAGKVLKNIDAIAADIQNPVFNFYYSLSLLSLYSADKSKESIGYLNAAVKNQKKLKKWAYHAPMNNLHKYNLVEAEISSLKGDHIKAMDLYDKAIAGAHENEYLNDEAIANELAAKYYLSLGKNKFAGFYMIESHNCYYRWGAIAKVKQIENDFPELLGAVFAKNKQQKNEGDENTYTMSTSGSAMSLDFSTVMKSTNAISSEIDLGKLLDAIMKFSLESAGAQKGFLILENESDKNLYIEAESSIEDGIRVLNSIPVKNYENLSISIVNYVNKSNEDVVLNHATEEGMFKNDPYILKNKIKSILCMPIMYKQKIAGILYLENNITANAFTPERLELLRILSSQAAISIENAALYQRAVIDGLTQIYNRAFFDNYLIKCFAEAKRYNKNLSLLIIDIDHFKKFNDTYGHQVGDVILKSTASNIHGAIRLSDLAARYGGEEFVVVMPGTGIVDAILVAEKIRKGIEKMEVACKAGGIDLLLKVTVSIGAAEISEDDDRIALLEKADKNLYKAKDMGRNRVV